MKKWIGLISYIGATLFLLLFYKQGLGVNQALFGIFTTVVVFIQSRNAVRSRFLIICMVSVVLLSIAVAWHGETWSRIVLFFGVWLMAGAAIAPSVEWPVISIRHALVSPVAAQSEFLSQSPSFNIGRRKTRFTDNFLIYLIPVIFIILFLIFYSRSNPLFDAYMQNLMDKLGHFTQYIRFGAIFTFLLGLAIVNMFVYKRPILSAIEKWSNAKTKLDRTKVIHGFRKARFSGLNQSLRHEYKAAFFLILSLNVLLFLLNLADVKVVWTNFEWNGQLLKNFVHEGTWYLIISIILSVGVIVFFFRGNLNFFSHSARLRTLAYIWIIQNAFLALSVALRNYHYIEHYGLAFKRIGVVYFLGAILVALALVWFKVKNKHSYSFWKNQNISLAFAAIVLSALFDWSSIITRYNLSNYKKSFVHMEFLFQMPPHTLPIFLEYTSKFDDIKREQLDLGYGYEDSVDNKKISDLIQEKTESYIQEQKLKTWQEWSYKDEWANKQLLQRR